MIKYLELTAPEESQFRQAKILSVTVSEGDEVSAGDTLFRVQSGSNEVDLPSRLDGRVIEIIVDEGENISLMTPLVLLETEVEKSTATLPMANGDDSPAESNEEEPEPSGDASEVIEEKSAKKKTKPEKKPKKKKTKKAKNKSSNSKPLEQQSLDLGDEPEAAQDHSATAEQQEDQSNQNDSAGEAEGSPMSSTEITVPDIGIDSAKVIEILVAVGDTVNQDDSLVTLESDKASMDVPCTAAGVIESIAVSIDQDVAEGDLILTLSSDDADTAIESQNDAASEVDQANHADEVDQAENTNTQTAVEPAAQDSGTSSTTVVDVAVPDIGGDSAKVIEILVEAGAQVSVDDPLITLESDKASMDVPCTVDGVIDSIAVSIDDEVSEGALIVKVTTSSNHSEQSSPAAPEQEKDPQQATQVAEPPTSTSTASASASATPTPATAAQSKASTKPGKASHASPSVRRLARELGADLAKVSGSGRKNRITKEDLKAFVKGVMTEKSSAGSTPSTGAGIPAIPAVDFSKFGEIDIQPLNKIKKLTAANLHRSWLNVPHVTHNDESDISDLESFRKQLNEEYKRQGKEIKLSPLAFIVKAVVNALQTFPQFNASLEPGGENLIYKKYFHIGIAVDTPNGLVVPVVKDADTKSVAEIATEMGELAAKARDKKLTPADMSGACFTISSLGGIGGTGFTPIVNAPEVAILGVSRSKMQPVWNGVEFVPGMILPLSLSYDHRVIDGAEAARFTRQIAAVLEDVRRLAV